MPNWFELVADIARGPPWMDCGGWPRLGASGDSVPSGKALFGWYSRDQWCLSSNVSDDPTPLGSRDRPFAIGPCEIRISR